MFHKKIISIGKVLQHNSAAELYINSSLKVYFTKYFIRSNKNLYQIMGRYQYFIFIESYRKINIMVKSY